MLWKMRDDDRREVLRCFDDGTYRFESWGRHDMAHIQQREQIYVCMYLETWRKYVFAGLCMYVIDSVFFLTNTPWVTPRHVTRSNMYHTNSKVYSVLLYVIVNMYVYILGVLSLTRAGRTASGASLLWFYNCQSQIIRHKLVFESFEIYNYVWLCWLARMP